MLHRRGVGLLLHPHRQPHPGPARRPAGQPGARRGGRGVRFGHGRHHGHAVVHAGTGRRGAGRPDALRLHLFLHDPRADQVWREGAPCGHARPGPAASRHEPPDQGGLLRIARQPQHAPGRHRRRGPDCPRRRRQAGGRQHLLHALPAAAPGAGRRCERALHDQIPGWPRRPDGGRRHLCRRRAGQTRAPLRLERHDRRRDERARRPAGDARPEDAHAAHGPPLPECPGHCRTAGAPPRHQRRALPRPAQLPPTRTRHAPDEPVRRYGGV